MKNPKGPTVREVSKAFRRTERCIRQWRETGAPIHDENALFAWLDRREEKTKGSKELRTKLAELRLEIAKHQLEQKKSRYISVNDSRREMAMLTDFCRVVLSRELLEEHPKRCEGKRSFEIQRLGREAVDRVCQIMSEGPDEGFIARWEATHI